MSMYSHGKALYKIKFVYIYYNYIFKVSAALHQDVTSLKCFMPEGILIMQNLILGVHSNRLLTQYIPEMIRTTTFAIASRKVKVYLFIIINLLLYFV